MLKFIITLLPNFPVLRRKSYTCKPPFTKFSNRNHAAKTYVPFLGGIGAFVPLEMITITFWNLKSRGLQVATHLSEEEVVV